MDFEEAAHRKVLPGHWAYMASGVDDDATLRANREGYQHVQLRPRRLRDATKVDMRTELFGTVVQQPHLHLPDRARKFFIRTANSPWRARPRRAGRCRCFPPPPHRRGGCELGARQAGLVSALRAHRVGGMRKNRAAGGSGRVSGDRADRRQHHRPQQRNLPAHPPEGSSTRAWRAMKGGLGPTGQGTEDVRRDRHDGRRHAESGDDLGVCRPAAKGDLE